MCICGAVLFWLPAVCLARKPGSPSWYESPPRDNATVLYETGSSVACATREEAIDQAYATALRSFANRISVTVYSSAVDEEKETSSRRGKGREEYYRSSAYKSRLQTVSNHQLVGTDIVEEEARSYRGKWYAWTVVSYPRVQYEKALKRVPETLQKAKEDPRVAVLVCPLAFGEESEEQFPEVVASFKSKGYGNAIWQTVEDKLYETAHFQVVTPPAKRMKSMLQQILGSDAALRRKKKLPSKILLCNMNFFEMKTESLRFARVTRNKEYHVELMLEYYDMDGEYGNVKIPAKGEARDKDLLVATDQAAEKAINKLMSRLD